MPDEDNTVLANEETVEESTVLAKEETGETTTEEETTSETEVVAKVEDGEKPEETKDGDKKADDGKEGAPEKYEDFTLPEGFEVDQALLEQAVPVFKDLNLSQDQAQKLVDLQTAREAAAAEANAEAWQTMVDGWLAEAKDDKEVGGAEFEANLATAREAVKVYGDDDLKEMFNITGVGNNPHMIRFLTKVGQAVKEDTIVQGSASPAEAERLAKMYPTMHKQE